VDRAVTNAAHSMQRLDRERRMKAMKIDFAPRSVRRTCSTSIPPCWRWPALACCCAPLRGGWQLAEQRREREHQLQHLQERVAKLVGASSGGSGARRHS
jgi:hypothetical protein